VGTPWGTWQLPCSSNKQAFGRPGWQGGKAMGEPCTLCLHHVTHVRLCAFLKLPAHAGVWLGAGSASTCSALLLQHAVRTCCSISCCCWGIVCG
jgi:hypothetical protein